MNLQPVALRARETNELTDCRWNSGPSDLFGRLQVNRHRRAVLPLRWALDVGDDVLGELIDRRVYSDIGHQVGGRLRSPQKFVARRWCVQQHRRPLVGRSHSRVAVTDANQVLDAVVLATVVSERLVIEPYASWRVSVKAVVADSGGRAVARNNFGARRRQFGAIGEPVEAGDRIVGEQYFQGRAVVATRFVVSRRGRAVTCCEREHEQSRCRCE